MLIAGSTTIDLDEHICFHPPSTNIKG